MARPAPLAATDDILSGRSAKAVGQRLRLTRTVLDLQQGEFGARAGIKHNTMSQIEAGDRLISLENAQALCDTYDLTLDWIYRGDLTNLRYQTADAIKALLKARSD